QLGEILDDAVMHDGDVGGKMRVRIGLVRHAMGRPARMADADGAAERLVHEATLEIDQLALCTAAGEVAVIDGGDAGGIVTAIFQPLQRIDDQRRYGRTPDNPANSAHRQNTLSRLPICRSVSKPGYREEIKKRFSSCRPNRAADTSG